MYYKYITVVREVRVGILFFPFGFKSTSGLRTSTSSTFTSFRLPNTCTSTGKHEKNQKKKYNDPLLLRTCAFFNRDMKTQKKQRKT